MPRTHFNIVIDLLFTQSFPEELYNIQTRPDVVNDNNIFIKTYLRKEGWERETETENVNYYFQTIQFIYTAGEGDKGLTLLFLCTVEETAP